MTVSFSWQYSPTVSIRAGSVTPDLVLDMTPNFMDLDEEFL